MKQIVGKAFVVLTLPLFIASCGTTHKLKFQNFTEDYKQSNYCKAADTVLGKSGVCNMTAEKLSKSSFDIDEQLNGGTSLFLAKKHNLSDILFEKASSDIQESLSSTGITRGAVEVIANASLVDYNPMIMDSIYLHSYSLLNALSENNKAEAKIQVNRAHMVQQNAANVFSKEIAKQTEETSKDVSDMAKEAKAQNDKNIDEVMSNYKEFARWKGYSNFVNPYMTYMSGLYFMTNGTQNSDYETASNYMKRVSGMVAGNSFVKQDLAIANKLASGQKNALKPATWVIFENGLVANFEEFRIDLPIFIATNQVKTASLALPYPKEREAAYPNITVSNGKQKVTTQLLTDVDSIFIAEFKKKLPVIVSKAVTKLAVQTTAQVIAQREYGDLGGIAAAAYSVMTAGADTRSWYSLPKNVQLAKINKNGKKLTLMIGGQNIDVEIPDKGNSLVYVRVPSANAVPVIEVINL